MEEIKVACEVIKVIALIGGGFFAYFKWGRGQKTTPARYLKVLIGEFGKDAIQKYCIEVTTKDSNDKSNRTNSVGDLFKNQSERLLAKRKTLNFFAYVCHAYKAKLISETEFSFFEQHIKEVVGADLDIQTEIINRASKSSVYRVLMDIVGPVGNS